MSDLIDRQAAIDAVTAEGRDVDSRYLESERIILEADAVEALAILPSAQPEIIRCKDCIFAILTPHGEYLLCRYWESDGLIETDFCSHAERRTE